ncbi:hypothetical protein Tco_1451979, partial [Tanacetum coccineum]
MDEGNTGDGKSSVFAESLLGQNPIQ